jgi:hypothetical protein
MKDEKKSNLFEEHLRKIKFRTDYKINETAKYKYQPMGEEFDKVPTNEAGDQEDAPKPEGEQPPAPTNDQPLGAEAPVPAFDKTGGESQLPPEGAEGAAPANPMGDDMNADPNAPPMGGGMGAPDPSQQVDTLQNDIIKHNIEAMKSIHDKLESLDSTVAGLNAQLNTLNSTVEEVREPTNSEKLMSKKNVSYPFYFNLNDFWTGNWFNESRTKEHEKGINELPDGTFVADFDDLPQKSKIDVQNSFNDI